MFLDTDTLGLLLVKSGALTSTTQPKNLFGGWSAFLELKQEFILSSQTLLISETYYKRVVLGMAEHKASGVKEPKWVHWS